MTTPGRGGSRPRPSAIRTFLIADIRGYTQFTNQLGDEAASKLAAKFAQIMAEGIEAWDGALVELRGDEALAAFDSPRRALRAAAELQSAFAAETVLEPHLPLTVGIGVDAGEAMPVGDGYRGAALNLAARLCASAAAGEIRTSESVAHLAGPIGGLTLSRLEPTEFKGIEGMVTPMLVASDEASDPLPTALPDPPASAPLPPGLDSVVPFAGRQPELRRLRWHWRRTRHGRSRVVLLTGPAGIGKTRMAAQLAAVARREGGAVVYRSGATLERDATPGMPDGPTLLVVDDLDRASATELDAWRGRLSSLSPATMTVLTSQDGTSDPIAALIEAAGPSAHLELGPLDSGAVLEIVRLYAEDAADEVPLHLIEAESDGVPLAVHRVASQWARSHAIQRLGRSAQRTASGRRELRSAEDALIDDVGDLERARERTLLVEAETGQEGTNRAMVCPYKGLASFDASDADYFFGRDRLVAELVAKLVGSPFVALVGASGSGKSSVLRAGLLPALANGVLPTSAGWEFVVMRPGAHPLRELVDALSVADAAGRVEGVAAHSLDQLLARLTPTQRLLLVVDQFEELFSAPDEAERLEFIDLLTGRHTGLKVIVALRADQYGRAASYPSLARALGTDQVLVGPVTASELGLIIERPAQRVGLRVEPELTDALVADAGEEPGALPLLSTALLELWQARAESTLTMAAYLARGGLRGAVARLAEAAYGRLTPEERATARSIFLRLAGQGDGDTVIRRRVSIDEFDPDASSGTRSLITSLSEARLLSTGDGYVEVAHEALLREWPRLVRWLEEDAAGRQLRLHLVGTARGWDEAGREPGDLYRGARLAAVLDWVAEHDAELNATERAFIGASRRAAEEEANRQRTTNHRLRLLLGGAAVFLVAALGAGGVAVVQSQQAQAEAARADAAADEANRERTAAERAALLNRSRELAASAITQLESDPTLSRLLALTAATIVEPPEETVSALRRAVSEDRVLHTFAWPQDRRIDTFGPALHPDGTLIALGGWGSRMLEVIDRDTEAVVWSYDAGDGLWVGAPSFSRDAAFLVASISSDGETHEIPPPDHIGLFLWRAATGELVRRLDGGTCGPDMAALSDTFAVIAVAPEDELADGESCYHFEQSARELIDLATGERTLLTAEGDLAVLSADGSIVGYEDLASEDPQSVIAETATGERLLTIDPSDLSDGLNPGVRALSPGGDLLIYGDRPLRIWDVATGERIGFFHGHGGFVGSVVFSPDGASVYSTGIDSRLRHWDARSGEEIRSFGPVSPERLTIASDSALVTREGGTAALFDVAARGEAGAVETCRGFALAETLRVIGDRAVLAVAGCGQPSATDVVTVVADLASSTVVTIIPEHGAQGIALSPDGTRLVRQEGTYPKVGFVTIRDARTGDMLTVLEGACTYDTTAERDEAGVPLGCNAIPEPPFPVWPWELNWSPDGDSIVAVNDLVDARGGFAVWDARSGAVRFAEDVGRADEDVQVVLSATFTPDGDELLVATMDEDASPDGDVVSFRRYMPESGELLDVVPIDGLRGDLQGFGIRFIGYSADGRTLYVVDRPQRGATLAAIDLETLEVTRSRGGVTDAQAKSYAISPDRSLIAMGTSDGYVRVWNSSTFRLVQEIFVADTQVQGLAFLSDSRLAVVPEEGNILYYALDVEELVSLARQALTRGFTPDECQRFNFGDDCPTLEELRAGS